MPGMPSLLSRFWWSRDQLGQGCIWWTLAAQRREGTLPQHSWEQWQGTAGVEWHVSFMPVWACVRPRSNRAVLLLVGLARKHFELDRDVLVGICEWGERRTMQRLGAKCFQ